MKHMRNTLRRACQNPPPRQPFVGFVLDKLREVSELTIIIVQHSFGMDSFSGHHNNYET